MESKPKVLAVIGARSGSIGVPNKNIRPLCGRPLFTWIADAAKKSKHISRLIISTDSQQYADIARKHGLEAPFLRPAEISHGKSTDEEYLIHAAQWFQKNENWSPDIVLRLMSTSPLCQPKHIDKCIDLLISDPSAEAARIIYEAPDHPYKMWRADGDYLIPTASKEFTGFDMPAFMPRQALPKCYIHGDPIAVRNDVLLNKKSMGEKIRYHIIPQEEAADIDSEVDFLLAEILLKQKLDKQHHS
ncbi:MAG: acylneuraminate cytidylyltransferase family protein [bacterium]|nr:acylneuraminate cytidylyltransferase family protein [bacterium]